MKKIITFETALQLTDSAESMMAHNEFEVSSAQVLALVEQSNCSSCDCEFAFPVTDFLIGKKQR